MLPQKCLIMMASLAIAFAAPSDSSETSAENNHRIAKECLTKYTLTSETISEFHQNPEDPPKMMLCYMKCFLERKGLLDEQGNINLDYKSNEDDEEEYSDESSSSEEYVAIGQSAEDDLSCLKHLEPIKTCSDMKRVLKCLPNVRYSGNK
ncbi:uncharacterized protein LOC123320532 [Coccinella septempunctata]|uniref:uncharacterized protein LOC123320532 n=1 Tax=Coccinella septempunctata TaxID=41139 RepID=UPI001D085127|nr:uncharacterized protein LOC123320532 [Coccinella septempunctata]